VAVALVGYHVGRCSVMLSSAAVVCARSLFGKQLRVGDDFEKQNVADVHCVFATCLPLQKYVRRTAGKLRCAFSSSRVQIDIRFRGARLVS
jgi:hypothetical protein